MKIIFIASTLFIGFALIWHYQITKTENRRLKIELQKANVSINALGDVIKKRNEVLKKERDLMDEIDEAPQKDNAIIAPVLLRTLNSL